jgi:hypothetical protein
MIQGEIPVQENSQGGVNITSAVTKSQGRNMDHYLKRVSLTKLCVSAFVLGRLTRELENT